MPTDSATEYGACPLCAAAISSYEVLIEYQTSNNGQRAFAECPECQAVVHPR